MIELPLLRKPIILIFTRYYLPGFRAGGPVRSVANLVFALNTVFDFRIVCYERDLGSNQSYPNIKIGQWQKVNGAMVRYASMHELGFSFCKRMFYEIKPDVIYLNSLFDLEFSIKPFFALGRGAATPIVLSPRGELSPAALNIKPLRKLFFLKVLYAIRAYENISWHACSKLEAEFINQHFLPKSREVFLASNLPELHQVKIRRNSSKISGKLRIAMVARISPMKNTIAAIRIACQLSGYIELDFWGLLEDKEYWAACQREINLCSPEIKINYRGEVEHEKLHALLCEYDALLLPTLGENFGHSIIESLNAGLPVVISDRTPWRNLERDGVGVDLPLDDLTAFANALAKYQSMNEMEMALVRLNCKRYAAEWQFMNAKLDDYTKMFNEAILTRVALNK